MKKLKKCYNKHCANQRILNGYSTKMIGNRIDFFHYRSNNSYFFLLKNNVMLAIKIGNIFFFFKYLRVRIIGLQVRMPV